MEWAIVAAGALSALLAVLAAGLPLAAPREGGKARLKALRARREARRAEAKNQRAQQAKRVSFRERMGKKTASQKLADKINIAKLVDMDSLKLRLSSAGWRGADTPQRFLLARLVLPAALGGYAAWMAYAGPLAASLSGATRPAAAAGAVALGLALPGIVLKNAIQKRGDKLSKQFPDALDLMLVCVEAGLTVEQAFMRITEEMGDAVPEIAEEFALTGAELAFLGDKRQAYDNLTHRVANAEFKSLATTLIQSDKYGTPVGAALRILSEEARKNRTNTVEKKAAGLGPKMTVPMILFILPCLFLIVIGPAVINIRAH